MPNLRLRQHQANLIADAILNNPGQRIPTRLIGRRSGEDDHTRLRGIPVTTRGVAGTQLGSNPTTWIDRIHDDD